MSQRERLTIYTLAWRDDAPVAENAPKEGAATIHCRAFLNEREVHSAVSAQLNYRGGDFTTVLLEIAPSSVKIVECDRAEWEALG